MGNVWTRRQLRRRSLEHTPVYDFNGQTKEGKIVEVQDGDTCRAIVYIDGGYRIITVRCFGYDAPEIIANAKDQTAATASKKALENMVLNRIVRLHFYGFDNYGRFLAKITVKAIAPRGCCRTVRQVFALRLDVNAAMIEGGRGTPYFGGTKPEIFSKPGVKPQCNIEGEIDNENAL